MTQGKETLCQVGDHWCTECCEGMDCTNLGQFSDNSWGCLGHGETEGFETITQDGLIAVFPITDICKNIDCLEGYDVDRQLVIDTINDQKSGEFIMTHILTILDVLG